MRRSASLDVRVSTLLLPLFAMNTLVIRRRFCGDYRGAFGAKANNHAIGTR